MLLQKPLNFDAICNPPPLAVAPVAYLILLCASPRSAFSLARAQPLDSDRDKR